MKYSDIQPGVVIGRLMVRELVVPCCKHCNVAKMSMSVSEFLAWVTRVYHHNFGRGL